jgi:ribosomal protein S6
MRKTYDCIIFLKPTLSEAEQDAVINKIKTYIAEGKGDITEERRPEKRRLPFIVKKSREAFRLYMKFSADSLKVNEIKDRIRLIEGINRFTIANFAETLKDPEKIRKRKEAPRAEGPAASAPAVTPAPAVIPAPAPVVSAAPAASTAPTADSTTETAAKETGA